MEKKQLVRIKVISLVILSVTILSLGALTKTHCQVENTPNHLSIEDSLKMRAYYLFKNSTPVLGYRFVIFGDFDGDHVRDTLCERYTDSLFQKEAPKYYISSDTNFEYDDVISINRLFKRMSFVDWKKEKVRLEGGDLGFHYMENCGDLNLDGKDELLVVRQVSDFSNLNDAEIYTYSHGNWKKIYTIPIWEWQFPPTPNASMIPGLFGDYDFGVVDNDSTDKALEKQLKEFKFIEFYPDNSIEFSGRNPIELWDDDKAKNEYDELGDQKYLRKYYNIVYIKDSLYLRSKMNPSIYYKADESRSEENEKIILFDIEDPANMVTTRIYIKDPKSPFKLKTN